MSTLETTLRSLRNDGRKALVRQIMNGGTPDETRQLVTALRVAIDEASR